MAHVENQKQHSIKKKGLDAIEVSKRTNDFISQMKEKNASKRNMVTDQQNYNRKNFDTLIDEKRAKVDYDRKESLVTAQDEVQKLAFLE